MAKSVQFLKTTKELRSLNPGDLCCVYTKSNNEARAAMVLILKHEPACWYMSGFTSNARPGLKLLSLSTNTPLFIAYEQFTGEDLWQLELIQKA